MYIEEVFAWSRRVLLGSFLPGVLVVLVQGAAFAAGSVTLTWNPSAAPIVAGDNVYYGGTSGIYTNEISVGNSTNTTVSRLISGDTYYFAVTAYTTNGIESSFSSEISFLVPSGVNTGNQPPTLNVISN